MDWFWFGIGWYIAQPIIIGFILTIIYRKKYRNHIAGLEPYIEEMIQEAITLELPTYEDKFREMTEKEVALQVRPVIDEIAEVNRMVVHIASNQWFSSKLATLQLNIRERPDTTTVNIGKEEFVFKVPMIASTVENLINTFTRSSRN